MIVAHADGQGGKKLLILGLSRGNLDRLTDGKPILMTHEKHPGELPDGWEIAILFGETEQAIVDLFRREGLIDTNTEIKREPTCDI